MATTNGLTKSVWAEYKEYSGEGVFAITHAIYNPSYVEWLESELKAARQKIKVAEQTPTNNGKSLCYEDCGANTDLVVKYESCFEKYRR